MTAADIGAFATVAGVVTTVLGGLLLLAWRGGRHTQRLEAAEDKIKKLEADGHAIVRLDGALQVLTTSMNSIKESLGDVQHDVKNLLTGKVGPGSRARE